MKETFKMDALYLKNNVYGALTEALASMAVALPEDKVEYLGRYLLKYVERKKAKEEAELVLQDIVLRQDIEEKEKANAEVCFFQRFRNINKPLGLRLMW